jgi:hypothetical protein
MLAMAGCASGFVAGVAEDYEVGEHKYWFFGCDFLRQI